MEHVRQNIIVKYKYTLDIVEELKTNLMSLVIFCFTYYLLNMFRTLIRPSSGACDCVDGLPHRLSCSLIVVCWGLLRVLFGGVRFAG